MIGNLKVEGLSLAKCSKGCPRVYIICVQVTGPFEQLNFNTLPNHRTPVEEMNGKTGDLSHLQLTFWTPIWYNPVGTDKSSNDTMIKGRYLGLAESTGDDVTHCILSVIVDKKSKDVNYRILKIPQKRKVDDRHREVIKRWYVCVRHPEENVFKGIIKDSSQSWLNPSKWFLLELRWTVLHGMSCFLQLGPWMILKIKT